MLLALASSTGKAQSFGAICFGSTLGWYAWYTLRQEKTHTAAHIAAFTAVIGAASLTKLFPDRLFGYYCIGLALGFFACVIVMGRGWIR